MTIATAVVAENGAILLPKSVGDELHLKPGDDLEIEIDDDEDVVIRIRPKHREESPDFVDVLFSCPFPLEIPPREKDLPPPIDFNAD